MTGDGVGNASVAAAGAMHNVVQTGYDALGRPECVAQRMNPASWASLPASACTPAATGAFGPDRISRTTRDSAGQVTQVRTAVGTPLEAVVATSTYGANGQTLTVTDGESNRTSYEYDGLGRLRRTYFPLAAQGANASNAADYEELGYDAAGNVVSRRNRAGETAAYTVDALGRTVLKDLPSTEPDVTYSYDLLGRMTSATQPGHVLSFTFDALGRQLTQTNPMGTIASVWDLAGRRTRITYVGGYYVEHDYLATGEVSAIRENGATSGVSVIAVFGYDLLGRRTSLTRGNGVVTNYSYGPDTRLSQLVNDAPGTNNDLTLGFTYNPAGQILSNTRSNSLFSYTGPAAGTTNSTANGLNQLAAHGTGTPTYDARGNLASEGGRTFMYSSENLLTGFAGHGRTMTWTWDPLMRVHHQTTSGANPRTYLFDGNNMIIQNMNGAMLARYVYGPGDDEPIYSIDNQGRRGWFVADERGSILGETDTAGTLGTPRTYDEYGNASSLSYQHGYAGTLYLGLSRLYYNRARIYDPTLGRFLQTDPIGYGDGMNMYAYVGGDPVNGRDPSGTCSVTWGLFKTTTYPKDGSSDSVLLSTDTDFSGCGGLFGGMVLSYSGDLGGSSGGTGMSSADRAALNSPSCQNALRGARQDSTAVVRAIQQWPTLVEATTGRNWVPPRFLAAIGIRESGFSPVTEFGCRRSPCGQGVFQITGQPDVNGAQAFDLRFSAHWAAGYLDTLISDIINDFPNFTLLQSMQAGAASYNMGPGEISGNPATIDVGTRYNNYGSNVIQLASSCFSPTRR